MINNCYCSVKFLFQWSLQRTVRLLGWDAMMLSSLNFHKITPSPLEHAGWFSNPGSYWCAPWMHVSERAMAQSGSSHVNIYNQCNSFIVPANNAMAPPPRACSMKHKNITSVKSMCIHNNYDYDPLVLPVNSTTDCQSKCRYKCYQQGILIHWYNGTLSPKTGKSW